MRPFAENLFHMRYDRDLTVAALSKLSCVHANTIYQYETDRVVPSLYKAMQIADALGVSIDKMCVTNHEPSDSN